MTKKSVGGEASDEDEEDEDKKILKWKQAQDKPDKETR